MSDATRWQRVKEVFDAAVACPVEKRSVLVRQLCGEDHALRAEIESLLAADAGKGSIFDHSLDRDLRGRVFDTVADAFEGATRALTPGDRFGIYEISGFLGRGGMGEVYRARDTRLNRDVALKILPGAFAMDSGRLARFRREAQVLASLNHPNIGHIYGLEEAQLVGSGRGGSPALVLELVEGPTLADWIGRGPVTVAEALPIAVQIAEALEAAHEQGIVHRDLKPANIKVRPDGKVKVLDFGLAKAIDEVQDSEASGLGPTSSPTVTSPAAITGAHAILGTAPYLSPEQARGHVVDKRADIWTFGCVLFEMLTGRRPFDGETTSDTIAAILSRQPDWDLLPAVTPSGVRVLLQRCLEKDPKDRLRDIGDARGEIARLVRTADEVTRRASFASGASLARRSAVPIALAVVVLAGVAAVLYFTGTRPAAPLEYTRLTDFADPVTSPSLSPDGRFLTFKRGGNFFTTRGQIYVKLLPNGEPVQLTNDNVPKFGPVFTPDGSRIAYTQVSGGAWDTWTVPVLGGQPARLLPNASGLTWIADKRVLFSEMRPGGIHMGLVTATELRADSREIYFPEHQRAMAHFSSASPDRKSILIVEMDSTPKFSRCRLVPFDGSSPARPVGPEGACIAAAWSPDGRWMYFSATVDGNSHLWRQAFPDGVPQRVTSGPSEESGVAVAPDGSLVTSIGMQQNAIWIHDENGERQVSSEGSAAFPRLSRDARLVFYLQRPDELTPSAELRVLEIASGHSASLLPGWSVQDYDLSPDESEVAVTVAPNDGDLQIWIASLDRRSPPREVTRGGTQVSFGADGTLIYRFHDKHANFLYRINRDGTSRERMTSQPILQKLDSSPDGAWVTASIPAPDERASQGQERVQSVAIPVHGGAPRTLCTFSCDPSWSPDGKFLQLRLLQRGSMTDRNRTIRIPVPIGSALPDLPENGLNSAEDALKLPGVAVISEDGINAGPGPSTYVFLRSTVQRNLFRIRLGR